MRCGVTAVDPGATTSGRHVFRPSKLPFWAGAAWRTALAALGACVVAVGYASSGDGLALPMRGAAYPAAGAAVAAYALFEAASAQLRAMASRITVGDGRIFFETGYVSVSTRSMWISEVTGVDTARTLVGRMAGYGDVTVEARGVDSLTVRRVAGAQRLAKLVAELKGDGRVGGAPPRG